MPDSFERLFEIDELISQKQWTHRRNNVGQNVREVALELAAKIDNDDQYELIKHLLGEYFLCTDYDEHCWSMSQRIEHEFSGRKVVIIPVSDESQKIKSGHSVAYDLTRFIDSNKFETFQIRESIVGLQQGIKEYSIIAVDDFIGSGTQFRSFSKKTVRENGVKVDHLHLYAIVMMQRAVSRVQDFCGSYFSMFKFQRSLSDDPILSGRINKLETYKLLESRLGVGKNYKRGYLKSESLVTLKKTPNNTLPVFWQKKASDGTDWPAIFPRR
ncbi:phosphoribosyltransferase-like protein [Aureimonas leprariae]|uniref:PRTase-CE domain-containing protein n=1 Tax=Plantimonas leprariae TaxID=2615207 RepID=A0A7V7PRE4_9HYPH|nr:hypothetical protein [Aureimonas leprariae]KAB0681305.1 hypothetical protein F6X38_05290 [Aureimonas leprariae]